MELPYRDVIENQKSSAKVAKDSLLALDLKGITFYFGKPRTKFKTEYFLLVVIIQYFNDAVFFHDDETIKKLKEFKFKPLVLRWFVSVSDIHEQYEIIFKSGIKIYASAAFNIIKSYLKTKLSQELLRSQKDLNTSHDHIRMTQLTKDLILLKGRKKYSGSKPAHYKGIYDYLLNYQLNQFVNLPMAIGNQTEKFDINTFIQISKGKTETLLLKLLLEECFVYDKKKISKTKFLSIVYDLFGLIIQDRVFIDEATYNEIKEGESTYKSFQSYKAKTMKAIIYPRRKTM